MHISYTGVADVFALKRGYLAKHAVYELYCRGLYAPNKCVFVLGKVVISELESQFCVKVAMTQRVKVEGKYLERWAWVVFDDLSPVYEHTRSIENGQAQVACHTRSWCVSFCLKTSQTRQNEKHSQILAETSIIFNPGSCGRNDYVNIRARLIGNKVMFP